MMKKITRLLVLCLTITANAQDFNDVFVAGVADAQRFAEGYLSPASEAAIYSISNGWYNSADAKPLGGFEISVIGNMTSFKNKNDKKAFLFNEADYTNLQLVGGSDARNDEASVATALGDISGVRVFVEDDTGFFREEFELPSGLSAEDFNFIPSAYVQVSVGLVKGLEVKARFLPNINFDEDAKFGLLGGGLQYDFTKLLPADKILPVAISAVVGYTNLNGEYDFTDSGIIAGSDQRIDVNFNTWNFSAVVSTRKIPVINFYGGIGYITGKSQIDFLGTYEANGPFFTTSVNDPISISDNFGSVSANIGTKIKLGFFRINAEYNISEFSTATVGVNFGFR